MPPAGASLKEAPRAGCGFVVAGQLGYALACHPEGCQTPTDTSTRKACLDAPTIARQNRSLPTEGKIRAAPRVGGGPAGARQLSGPE